MRVCLLAPLWNKGVHIRGWIEELAQRGVDSFTVSDSEVNRLPDFNYLKDSDSKLVRLKLKYGITNPSEVIRGKFLGSDFAWRFHGHRVRSRLKGWKIDLVHAHYLDPFSVLARYTGFEPWLASAWGSDLEKVQNDRGAADRVSWALSQAALVHVETRRQGRILESIGLSRERIFVRNWGVRTDIFRPGPSNQSLRLRLGIVSDEIVLISLRGHEENYCIGDILRAIVHLRRTVPQVRLIVGSSGSQTSHLVELAKQLGIDDRVLFVGDLAHDSLTNYYQTADMYVQAPLTDGVSYTLLEAMSSGLPVITTGTGDTAENVQDGENGLFFPVARPDVLAEKIARLASDRKARSALGERARHWVIKNCDRKESFDLFVSKYRELLNAH